MDDWRKVKDPSWERSEPVASPDVLAPEWVPILDDDEVDLYMPEFSLAKWLDVVFPRLDYPFLHAAVKRRLAMLLAADHMRGRLLHHKWTCVAHWNQVMFELGYTTIANDWR